MESFKYEKVLMQENFNENYVESHKYPQAVLKAKVENISDLDFKSEKPQNLNLDGTITIHNVTKQISIPGIITISNNSILAQSKFTLQPADFEIKIPKAVRDNIAKEIDVNIEFTLTEFNK